MGCMTTARRTTNHASPAVSSISFARVHKGTSKNRLNDINNSDARWAKNNEATHFGYNNHVAVDNAHKWVRDYEVTCAEVHDSQVFIELLADNTSADVWADSAYQNENNEISLAAMESVALFTQRAIGIIRYRSAARSRMLGVQKSVLESSPFLGH